MGGAVLLGGGGRCITAESDVLCAGHGTAGEVGFSKRHTQAGFLGVIYVHLGVFLDYVKGCANFILN